MSYTTSVCQYSTIPRVNLHTQKTLKIARFWGNFLQTLASRNESEEADTQALDSLPKITLRRTLTTQASIMNLY